MTVPVKDAAGKISGELVMCYPPGIPILTPGELITEEIIEYIDYSREKGCSLMGTRDPECMMIDVMV
jgi:arginine/lysine/ornithine decarboxylase